MPVSGCASCRGGAHKTDAEDHKGAFTCVLGIPCGIESPSDRTMQRGTMPRKIVLWSVFLKSKLSSNPGLIIFNRKELYKAANVRDVNIRCNTEACEYNVLFKLSHKLWRKNTPL